MATSSLTNLRKKLDKLHSQYRLTHQQLRQEKSKLAEARQREQDVLDAQQLVQTVAEGVQQSAHHQLAQVVTRCLKAVFGPEAYEFKINFVKKRGKTEAELVFVRDGMELEPKTASGGGVVDIAAFALRVSCLLLSMPRNRKLVVLDEPFKMLSKGYRTVTADLLQLLAKELKIQMVIVSHMDELTRIGTEVSVGD